MVIASFNGSPNHPSWYTNLMANPDVTIEVGSETLAVRGVALEGEAWDRAHAVFCQVNPEIAGHHARTTRKIPYVAFEPPA